MIAYFPVPYPDELLFSVLCRGTEHSGMYAKQSYFSQLLQEKKSIYLNMKYYNRFSEDAITFLGGDVAVRNLIMCHTLYDFFIIGIIKRTYQLNDGLPIPVYFLNIVVGGILEVLIH